MTEKAPEPRRNGATAYIVATVLFMLFGIILVFGVLFLRPESDPLVVCAAAGAFVTMASGIAASYFKAQEAKTQTVETSIAVNGKMTEMVELLKKVARYEGAEQERMLEQARVAAAKAVEPPVVLTHTLEVPEQKLEVQPQNPSEGKK